MIKIFVTNLGKYNEGSLVGEWLELPATEEQITTVMNNIGINEEYEEYFITDFECDVEGLEIKEYSNLENLNTIAENLDNLDSLEVKCIEALLEDGIIDMQDIQDDNLQLDNYTFIEVENTFLNNDKNLGYAIIENIYDNDITLVNNPDFYFDNEAFGRDLRFDFEQITDGFDAEDVEKLENMSDAEFANWYIDSLGDIKELGFDTIQRYFDYEKYGRDTRFEGAFIGSNNIAVL